MINPKEWFIVKFLVEGYEKFDLSTRIRGISRLEKYSPAMASVKQTIWVIPITVGLYILITRGYTPVPEYFREPFLDFLAVITAATLGFLASRAIQDLSLLPIEKET